MSYEYIEDDLDEDEENSESVRSDFVHVDDNSLLTNGTQWENIIHHMLGGMTIYHRYSLDCREDNENDWIRSSLTSKLPKDKIPFLVMEEIDEGPMCQHLSLYDSPDGEYFDDDNTYYCVWYLRPINNFSALQLLKRDELNTDSMRRWLDEQRTVIPTDLGQDIGVD